MGKALYAVLLIILIVEARSTIDSIDKMQKFLNRAIIHIDRRSGGLQKQQGHDPKPGTY